MLIGVSYSVLVQPLGTTTISNPNFYYIIIVIIYDDMCECVSNIDCVHYFFYYYNFICVNVCL